MPDPASPEPGTPAAAPGPVHLNNHHRDTLVQILQHPAGHNIEWRAVLSLLEAVASVQEGHDGNVLVTLGNETETFERPIGKDVDVQQVVDLRRMLRNAGYASQVDDVIATRTED